MKRRLVTLLFVLFATLASAQPIPELARAIEGQLGRWNVSAPVQTSTKWDFEQFYLQVNPYITIGAAVVQLQIQPQFGFLWVREAPAGCVPYKPARIPR